MSKLLDKKPALLLVDIQKAFLDKDYPGNKRNNLDAELICGKILKKWRELGLKVIHVRHSSTNPESMLHESKPGFEFNDHVKPINDEMVLTKKVNSAFIGTGLNEILKKSDKTQFRKNPRRDEKKSKEPLLQPRAGYRLLSESITGDSVMD